MASDFIEKYIINHVLRGFDQGNPPYVHMRLYNILPSDADTNGTEVTGPGYVAPNIMFAGYWSPAGDGDGYLNAVALTFGPPLGDWGNVVGFGFTYGQYDFNTISVGAFSNPRDIVSGDEPITFPVGSIRISFR